jgi:hypothetical protein
MKNRVMLYVVAAALAAPGLVSYGCTGSEVVHGPAGNGNGGTTGAGGQQSTTTGAGGQQSTTGAGGQTTTTTGAGGQTTTTGAGGQTTTTTGAGGHTTTTTGAGGQTTTTGAGGQTTTTTGAGGQTTTTTGAGGQTTTTTGAGGQTTTGAGGSGSTDPNCTSTNAKTGAACTVDCIIPCGYQGLGTKTCTCTTGTYASCPCPKPTTYMGAATAPYCTTADGTTTTLKNTACTTEWQECIGKDLVSGSTPQGCVCLLNATTNALQWYCGSTNKWFALSM